MGPTFEGFKDFVYNVMGVPLAALPADSPYLQLSYNVALETVNPSFACFGPHIYTQMVYNFGADFLVNYAPDQPGQTYFKDLREALGLNKFIPGLISASNDETTGQSWMIPDIFKEMNLSELELLKTPWGRFYLGWAQKYGPLWGLS